MVAALSAGGAASDPLVLATLARVPREVFVPHFWTVPPHLTRRGPDDVSEWWIGDNDDAGAALDLVYDLDRALVPRAYSRTARMRRQPDGSILDA